MDVELRCVSDSEGGWDGSLHDAMAMVLGACGFSVIILRLAWCYGVMRTDELK